MVHVVKNYLVSISALVLSLWEYLQADDSLSNPLA